MIISIYYVQVRIMNVITFYTEITVYKIYYGNKVYSYTLQSA